MNPKNPLGLTVWVAVSCFVHILLFKSHVNLDAPLVQRGLITILAIVLILPVHELVHFIFALIFCKGKAKIRPGKDPFGLPTLMTSFSADISAWKEIVIRTAPFVVLTLLFDLAFAFCSEIPFFFWIAATANCAGCYFDLVSAREVYTAAHLSKCGKNEGGEKP